jgi:hypothetical protein
LLNRERIVLMNNLRAITRLGWLSRLLLPLSWRRFAIRDRL